MQEEHKGYSDATTQLRLDEEGKNVLHVFYIL
jgi:hypothetical protein